jgi:hypothetical protein
VTPTLAKAQIVQCLASFWPEAIFADNNDQSSGDLRANSVLERFSPAGSMSMAAGMGKRWLSVPASVPNLACTKVDFHRLH